MLCPACHNSDTKVLDSRTSNDEFSIRRRRECLKCYFRFSTYEEIEILDLSVIKTNGASESYSREKLSRGIKRALEKRPVNNNLIKRIIGAIERDIQKTAEKNTILSSKIGQLVMRQLKKIDKVAYIRFASVYKSFEDVKEFSKELNKLIKQDD